MVYCSSAAEARDKVKIGIQIILREAGVCGDTVVLTGSDGIMMKSWLVDFLLGKYRVITVGLRWLLGTQQSTVGYPVSYYINFL